MKDYKLSEIRDICKKQRPVDKKINCFHCPIYKICIKIEEQVPYEWEIDFECEESECSKIAKSDLVEYGSATTYSMVADEPMIIEVNTPDEFIIYNEEEK